MTNADVILPAHSSSGVRTLLVVDDQASVCVSLQFFLDGAGYRVLTADSGRAAIALLDTEVIDGALIDVHMPITNGFDTCVGVQAKTRASGREVRVWFMTGAFTGVLEQRCREVGGLAVLRKPFDFPVLLAQLETGLAAPIPLPPPPATGPDTEFATRLAS